MVYCLVSTGPCFPKVAYKKKNNAYHVDRGLYDGQLFEATGPRAVLWFHHVHRLGTNLMQTFPNLFVETTRSGGATTTPRKGFGEKDAAQDRDMLYGPFRRALVSRNKPVQDVSEATKVRASWICSCWSMAILRIRAKIPHYMYQLAGMGERGDHGTDKEAVSQRDSAALAVVRSLLV